MTGLYTDRNVTQLADLFRVSFGEFASLWSVRRQATSDGDPPTEDMARTAAREMQGELVNLTEQLGRRASPGISRSDLGQADALKYAFVAIVDEILLNTEWRGQSAWRDMLLEETVFQSRLCGERVFDRIQAVMRVRNQHCLDLAEVYLDCLNLGFKGKYLAMDDGPAILTRLKADLFYFVHQYAPGLDRPAHVLIEAPDQNVLRVDPSQRSLGDRFRWYFYVLGILAIPFVIAALLWGHVYLELHDVLQNSPALSR
jgi:type VI secretion system protein ImpK